jgi:hypothetical protein
MMNKVLLNGTVRLKGDKIFKTMELEGERVPVYIKPALFELFSQLTCGMDHILVIRWAQQSPVLAIFTRDPYDHEKKIRLTADRHMIVLVKRDLYFELVACKSIDISLQGTIRKMDNVIRQTMEIDGLKQQVAFKSEEMWSSFCAILHLKANHIAISLSAIPGTFLIYWYNNGVKTVLKDGDNHIFVMRYENESCRVTTVSDNFATM